MQSKISLYESQEFYNSQKNSEIQNELNNLKTENFKSNLRFNQYNNYVKENIDVLNQKWNSSLTGHQA